MNILILNSWYYPNMKGGAEQSVKLLAENLHRDGHNVTVLTADARKESTIQPEDINGVAVYRLHTNLMAASTSFIQKVIQKQYQIKYTKKNKQIDKILDKVKPDIIHTNSLNGFSFHIWKYFSVRNIPIVHTLRDYSICSPRGINEDSSKQSFPYKVFLNYYGYRNKQNSRWVSCVTAPSDYTLNNIIGKGYFKTSERICVPNAIPIDFEKTKALISDKINRKCDIKRVLFAGRLLKIKGIELLLDAFSLIDNDDFRLIVCGEGDLTDLVKQRSKLDKRICYKGMLTNRELENEYMLADLVVFPSLWDEPFGRIIIEANCYGTAVLASDKGGIPEIMHNLGGGEMLTEYSAEYLAKKIQNLITNPNHDYYDNILKNIQKYSINTQINNFSKIYTETIHKDSLA